MSRLVVVGPRREDERPTDRTAMGPRAAVAFGVDAGVASDGPRDLGRARWRWDRRGRRRLARGRRRLESSASREDEDEGAARGGDVARERGCAWRTTVETFYRAESAQARDAAVVCVRAWTRGARDGTTALDATAASGARAVRYAAVVPGLRSIACNDVNERVREVLEENLDAHVRSRGVEATTTFADAQRLFAEKWLEGTTYDVVDVDGFGSANFTDGALRVVRYGGLFYATATDGRALCGQNAERCATAFGNAVVAPSRPSVNETALRVFIGDVVRRGAALKLDVSPVFSLFHGHGPVFRVMFRVDKGGSRYGAHGVDDASTRVGFIGYCDACGNTEIIKRPLIDVFGHNKTVEDADGGEGSSLMCSTCAPLAESGARSARLAVSGPLWIGSLHDRETVDAMRDEADALGWLSDDEEDASRRVKGQLSLGDLLDAFRAEADPALARSPHYFRTDELGRKGRAKRVPPRDVLITALRAEGFAAARSHLDPRGLKTNASVSQVVECANRVCDALDELEGRA